MTMRGKSSKIRCHVQTIRIKGGAIESGVNTIGMRKAGLADLTVSFFVYITSHIRRVKIFLDVRLFLLNMCRKLKNCVVFSVIIGVIDWKKKD